MVINMEKKFVTFAWKITSLNDDDNITLNARTTKKKSKRRINVSITHETKKIVLFIVSISTKTTVSNRTVCKILIGICRRYSTERTMTKVMHYLQSATNTRELLKIVTFNFLCLLVTRT